MPEFKEAKFEEIENGRNTDIPVRERDFAKP